MVAGAAIGTTALIADMADVVIAVKDADFYVTAPSEITAEACAEEGTVDILADDFDSASKAVRDIVALLPSNNLSTAPVYDFNDPASAAETGMSAAEIISACADAGSAVELKAKYAENCKTVLATVAGSTVGFVGFDGASVCPACAYKAEAFVKFCDAFNIPVVTLLSANGLCKERENQMLIASAKLTSAYAAATCPKLSVITGKAVAPLTLCLPAEVQTLILFIHGILQLFLRLIQKRQLRSFSMTDLQRAKREKTLKKSMRILLLLRLQLQPAER